MEAILYIVTTDCQWRQFPAFTTVKAYFYQWIREGRWEAFNHILVILSREQNGRDAIRWPRPFGQFCGLNKLYPVVVMPPS